LPKSFQGKLISYESIFGLESFVSKDGRDYADLNAEINARTPSIQVRVGKYSKWKEQGVRIKEGRNGIQKDEKERGEKLKEREKK